MASDEFDCPDDDVEPYTEDVAELLQHGFDAACKGLSVDVAEVRESLPEDDYPAVREVLKQAETCLNKAGSLYVEGGAYEDAPRGVDYDGE